MFGLRSAKRATPDRLLIYGEGGRCHKLQLPSGALNDVLDSVFANHPENAQSLWEISRLLTTDLLRDVVLQQQRGIKKMYLRPAPQRDYGLELQVDIESKKVADFAEKAYSELLGSQPVIEPQIEEIPPPIEEDVQAPRKVSPGRKWRQREDDLFGLAGEVDKTDITDQGLDIRHEDLPWLNPGDAIISPRRGPCRIKRVDDEQRQVLVHDENRSSLLISFDEVLAEFEFDDEA
ncbi:MAG: hypothetical protein QGF46_04760 [Planctomycetota bacterium]|jgi:hypothetical protein|nr:hypothetical protein [Planctomycetota bacterium]